jgi:hypothetical protein
MPAGCFGHSCRAGVEVPVERRWSGEPPKPAVEKQRLPVDRDGHHLAPEGIGLSILALAQEAVEQSPLPRAHLRIGTSRIITSERQYQIRVCRVRCKCGEERCLQLRIPRDGRPKLIPRVGSPRIFGERRRQSNRRPGYQARQDGDLLKRFGHLALPEPNVGKEISGGG